MGSRGVRGIRLEVIRVGGTTYTSLEALQRFASPSPTAAKPARQNSTTRQKQIDTALQSLDEFLYGGKSPLKSSAQNAKVIR
jgi:hypothetical protein